MSKYILGVDGGGTKSHLAIFDDTGKCVGTTVYGPLNHEGMDGSYAELESRLREVLSSAMKNAVGGAGEAGGAVGTAAETASVTADDTDGATAPTLAGISFAVFGLAGVDTNEQAQLISDIVRRIGISNFLVCNDAILGVPAGSPDCVGVCAINGTGFKVAAIDRSGAMLDTCGLGAYTDDRGGGVWYGERVCGEVYNALFKLGRPTVMRPMLFNLLGISDKSEYLSAVTRIFHAESTLYNSVELNGIVFSAAARGDDAALDILRESAAQYGGAIARLAMDMDFPCDEVLSVTLAGSVFVKQKITILHDMIKEKVAEILGDREVQYVCLDSPPVAGAVLLAAQKVGFTALSSNPTAVKAQLNAALER